MTYTRFGLTSRTLREAAAHEFASAYGYDASDILSDDRVSEEIQVSLSAKGWTVYHGGRNRSVGVTTVQDEHEAATTNRQELVAAVVDAGFGGWRDVAAEAMRGRALRSAGLTRWDASPPWSMLASQIALATGHATGFSGRRMTLMNTGHAGHPTFAHLRDDEPLGSTDVYARGDDPKNTPRDWLRGEGNRVWWRLEHTIQLLADERFPIRSVVVHEHETTIEMRHAIPETQMLGLVGVATGSFIGMDGIERGTPGGDAPIRKTEHSDMWNRMSFVTDTAMVPVETAPDGVDMRWARMFATRFPKGSTR